MNQHSKRIGSAGFRTCKIRRVSRTVKSAERQRGTKRHSIAFIGAGALATSMARSLSSRGYEVREFVVRVSRSSQKRKARRQTETLARELGARVSSLENCTLDAEIIWFAVPDDAIEQCSKRLARERELAGRIALHSSGALSSDALEAMRRAGASIASLHPMMSFSAASKNPELKDVWFSIEGEQKALRLAREIVKYLGGNVLPLRSEQKALYHAFGAMIAPLLVSHLKAAEVMGGRVGLAPKQTRVVMKPIVEKVVAAFLDSGADRAFSGPFLRGDVKTVERHLAAIRGSAEENAYRALAQYAIEHIKVEDKEKLRKLLAKP